MAKHIDGERQPEKVEGLVVNSKGSDNDVSDNTGGREDKLAGFKVGSRRSRFRQDKNSAGGPTSIITSTACQSKKRVSENSVSLCPQLPLTMTFSLFFSSHR